MDYNEALNLIHSHSKLKYKPSLSRIGKAMSCFNNLQDSFKTIHITGTNGKGTVSELIKNALNFSGYKVGIFTSPFVEDFCERMRINDETIDKQILADYAKSTQRILDSKGIECNEFEFITIIALRWFYDEGCDYVILEVGLGGEFDPTNLVKKPLLSIITSVSLDHTKYLGSTIEEIAKVKAGIIKENTPVITKLNLPDTAKSIIEKTAKDKNAPLYFADSDDIKILSLTPDKKEYIYNGRKYISYMIGQGHTENLSIFFLAMDVLKKSSVKISDDAIKKSAEKTIMPARLEIIKKDNKRIILDGAHNIESCNNGADAIIAHHIKTPIKLLYTSMADKDYKSNLKILRKISDNVILTKLDMPRVASLDDLKQTAEQYNFKTEVIENPSSALNFAIHNMADDDTLLICGSFYLAGEMRKKLHNI